MDVYDLVDSVKACDQCGGFDKVELETACLTCGPVHLCGACRQKHDETYGGERGGVSD